MMDSVLRFRDHRSKKAVVALQQSEEEISPTQTIKGNPQTKSYFESLPPPAARRAAQLQQQQRPAQQQQDDWQQQQTYWQQRQQQSGM